MDNTILPLIFRMKHISRWSLMYNTQKEDLMQHTSECAFLAHFLAILGNTYFGKAYNVDKIAACALFHDVTEVLTGDLPTPIKYYNDSMKNIYKQIEKTASGKLLEHVPKDLRHIYSDYLNQKNLSDEEKRLLKIADKLCAYVKCIQELNAGNKEFSPAHASIKKEMESTESEELEYFLKNCLPAFSLSLDELKATL